MGYPPVSTEATLSAAGGRSPRGVSFGKCLWCGAFRLFKSPELVGIDWMWCGHRSWSDRDNMCGISLSGLAALLLHEALDESVADETSAFRLTRLQGGFALVHDTPRDDDCVAVFRERVVLMIEPTLKDALGACRVDGQVDDDGAAILLRKSSREGDGTGAEVIWRCDLG